VASVPNLGRRWGGVWTYVQRPTGYSARLAKPSPEGGIFWSDRTGTWAVSIFSPSGWGPTLAVRKRARQPRFDYVWLEDDCRASDNAKLSICRHRTTKTNFILAFLEPIQTLSTRPSSKERGSPKKGAPRLEGRAGLHELARRHSLSRNFLRS
jgi:hypothetical protein